MSRPKATPDAAARKAVAPSLAALLSPARAEASRRNGAKSRGPKTPEGKARSSRNALKHGLRGDKFVVLGDEDLAAFDALEAALLEELAPEGALQAVLARRIVAATWRLERAERMEGELFARNLWDTTSFGLALIRDCHGARAFDTLLRYRGGTLAELWRALRTLKALQAEAAAQAAHQEAAAPAVCAPAPALAARPDEPERRRNACASDRARHPAERNAEPGPAPARPLPLPAPGPVGARLAPSPTVGAPDGAARGPDPFLARAPGPVGERGPNPFLARAPGGRAPGGEPIEPERRRNPGESAPPAGAVAKNGRTSLLAGTALGAAGRGGWRG